MPELWVEWRKEEEDNKGFDDGEEWANVQREGNNEEKVSGTGWCKGRVVQSKSITEWEVGRVGDIKRVAE